MPTARTETTIVVDPIEMETISLTILGRSPFICNRLAEKAKHELLYPKGRKTTADRAQSLKHEPVAEFQASPYTLPDEESPTLLAHMASAFKRAMATAALDLPGARKAQIGRLVIVEGVMVPIYGVPHIFSSIVRSADQNRTPDVRTRAIIPEWTAQIDVSYATPILNERSIMNLLAAAGKICGVGDFRTEKGNGNYGQFTLTDPDDAEVKRIMAEGGRAQQRAAMASPVPFDHETAELLAWFDEEAAKRGKIRKIAS